MSRISNRKFHISGSFIDKKSAAAFAKEKREERGENWIAVKIDGVKPTFDGEGNEQPPRPFGALRVA